MQMSSFHEYVTSFLVGGSRQQKQKEKERLEP